MPISKYHLTGDLSLLKIKKEFGEYFTGWNENLWNKESRYFVGASRKRSRQLPVDIYRNDGFWGNF